MPDSDVSWVFKMAIVLQFDMAVSKLRLWRAGKLCQLILPTLESTGNCSVERVVRVARNQSPSMLVN